jgi:hypothetical protein
MRNGQRHGIGKQTNSYGSSYEGEYVDEQYDGWGIFRFENGSRYKEYKGQFLKGKLHGFGEL